MCVHHAFTKPSINSLYFASSSPLFFLVRFFYQQKAPKKKKKAQSCKFALMGNVVELKVHLHCEECIKKILKSIKKIQDIDSYDVDTQLNKVTVTGDVTKEQVIRVLQKIGKAASNWEGDENSKVSL